MADKVVRVPGRCNRVVARDSVAFQCAEVLLARGEMSESLLEIEMREDRYRKRYKSQQSSKQQAKGMHTLVRNRSSNRSQ